MIKRKEREGELYVVAAGLLWSLFPILTILSYSKLDAITSLAWTTLVSSFLFFFISLFRSSWKNIFKKEILVPLFWITTINGILYYVFYYTGLRFTSAGNASIIATFEILFSFLFFNIWKKEYIHNKYIWGMIFMFISAIIILFPSFSKFQIGDILVFFAVIIIPLGNHFQKKLRSIISSEQILFYRTLFASPFLFLLAFVFGNTVIFPTGNNLIIILINGVFIFGLSRIFWIEGIHKISVTKAISLASLSPIFTLIFAYIFLKDIPTFIQISSIIPAVIGTYLLTRKLK